ncbi:MAG: hypothetical protein IJM66_10425 [Muribaculaceae bacterium]|nr:hypothetical protein [Muribaculaceae bacterium]
MKRYISNYTILASGDEVVNHITTVGDDGTLISILPFDRELGNTVYVPQPLCVAATSDIHIIEKAFHESASRQQLKQRLKQLNLPQPQAGIPATVLRLDFARHRLAIPNY